MEKQEIIKIFNEWWNDDVRCEGTPHCDTDDCDLCFTCLNELLDMFGLKYDFFKGVTEK